MLTSIFKTRKKFIAKLITPDKNRIKHLENVFAFYAHLNLFVFIRLIESVRKNSCD